MDKVETSYPIGSVEQKRARLLKTLLMASIGFGLLILVITVWIDPDDLASPEVIYGFLAIVVLAVLFFIAKRGYSSAALAIFIGTTLSLFYFLAYAFVPDTLAFLLIPILLVNIFYKLRWALVFSLLILGSTLTINLILGTSNEHFNTYQIQWYFLFLASPLVLVFSQHIAEVQNIRQSRLEESLIQLQAQDVEIKAAYDETLEGWARALELRDKETEGHSRRVTDLAVAFAKRLDHPEDDLVNVRRGALLHDVGKMAIPDSILHKPHPLSEDEWEIVQRHVVHAEELLSGIQYLVPALAIPKYHHENWDGNGYPHGLAGTDIPLPARLFAIIDNWDALTSKRPYRNAWTQTQTREYLVSEAGKKFDPELVEIFLELITDR